MRRTKGGHGTLMASANRNHESVAFGVAWDTCWVGRLARLARTTSPKAHRSWADSRNGSGPGRERTSGFACTMTGRSTWRRWRETEGSTVADVRLLLTNRRRHTRRAVFCYLAGAMGSFGLWVWQASTTAAYIHAASLCRGASSDLRALLPVRLLQRPAELAVPYGANGHLARFLRTDESWWQSCAHRSEPTFRPGRMTRRARCSRDSSRR